MEYGHKIINPAGSTGVHEIGSGQAGKSQSYHKWV